jgi:small subunit ribosomal protein S2
MTVELNLKNLLQAGAHFGHQTHKWNPKMKKYVYGERNGVYIIDIAQTIPLAKKAYDHLKKTVASGRPVLFVGTKRQVSPVIKAAAVECGAFHVTHRWLGGMLTNFKTVSLSIEKIRKVEKMKEVGDFALLTKKEQSRIEKNIAKLERNLGGIKNMRKLPGALFVVDPGNERIAIKEANALGIPVVAVTDTNCDPSGIDFVIPGNDDAIKSITLFTDYMADAVVEGSKVASNALDKDDKGDAVRDLSLEKEILSKYDHDIDLLQEEDLEEVVDSEEI